MKDERNTKARLERTLILVGVIIIPLAYSLFYLGAFWDPYSRLDKLPVAVVNNDAGAVINDEQRNLGNEIVDKLKTDTSLKWIFTDETDGKAGVSSNKYYAMIQIPQDFSASIASADSTDKHAGIITYESNEVRNFLASQIIGKAVIELEEQARADVNGELTNELSGKLQDVPDQLGDLSDGLEDMYDGAKDLHGGIAQVRSGETTLIDGISSLNGGLSDLKAGAQNLGANMGNLNAGIVQAASGAQTLSAASSQLPDLIKGITDLKSGAADLKSGVDGYVAGVNSLIAQNRQLAGAISSYVSSNPSAASDPTMSAILAQLSSGSSQLTQLEQSGTALKSGAADVKSGSAELAQGTSDLGKLQAGASQLSGAMAQLKDGSAQLNAGAQSLLSGISDAKAGSDDLLSGAKDLQSGTSAVLSGSSELKDGISTAKNEVDDSIADANDELAKTTGLGDYSKEPVELKDTTVNTVPNYGTAFAPYFMSLSMWVGALILFVGIYLDPDNRMPLLSRASGRKYLRSAIFALISLVQSFLLAFLVIGVLHLKVVNLPGFYLTCVLVSLVFMSIVQFLIINFGNVGKFLSILFLVLQLTACGGTFPMETVPAFFNVIYRFMPMTYSVNLLKAAISGVGSNALPNCMVLIGTLSVFLAVTIIASIARDRHGAKDRALSVQ